eukprot:CAMPEP_0182888364 /NCGR_PEP_ID=MMETSP0034_2-20130328/21385_1 /TAXON_ID=156128 /ORGANISM="Nephroselmis pyriformis, Strain CCMP717" /LENGTH=484 /DNA_ID=CAMNT_0025021791 /DNA_START=20 /DNA_END=1474 /DNA_ORIENTATION=-
MTIVLQLLVGINVTAFYAIRTWERNYDWHDDEALFVSADKVCHNSAKVQLNMGILERRRMNFGKALQRFRRAQEIEPGYCEPTYWIGLTLINKGSDVPAGINVLTKSLDCVYSRNDALEALNKLYTTMHQQDPGNGAPVEAWARILAQVEMYRDACDHFQQAGMLYSAQGDMEKSTSAIEQCTLLKPLISMADAQAAAVGAGPAAKGRVKEDAQDEAWLGEVSSEQVIQCTMVQQQLNSTFPTLNPRSAKAKLLAYKYFKDDGEVCRRISPHMHLALVHQLQSADAMDPWLQREWGETIAITGRSVRNPQEPLTHMEVSAAIFRSIAFHYDPQTAELLEKIAPGATAPLTALSPPGEVYNLDGQVMTAMVALNEAKNSFYRLVQLAETIPSANQDLICSMHAVAVQSHIHATQYYVIHAEVPEGPDSRAAVMATNMEISKLAERKECGPVAKSAQETLRQAFATAIDEQAARNQLNARSNFYRD